VGEVAGELLGDNNLTEIFLVLSEQADRRSDLRLCDLYGNRESHRFFLGRATLDQDYFYRLIYLILI